MVRDDLNREAAEARLNSQMDIEEKKRLADIPSITAEHWPKHQGWTGRLVRMKWLVKRVASAVCLF